MKVDKWEAVACAVVLIAFGSFVYWFMVPAFYAVMALGEQERKATQACHDAQGIVMKNFSDRKLYCVRYDYTIMPNWYNGREAK